MVRIDELRSGYTILGLVRLGQDRLVLSNAKHFLKHFSLPDDVRIMRNQKVWLGQDRLVMSNVKHFLKHFSLPDEVRIMRNQKVWLDQVGFGLVSGQVESGEAKSDQVRSGQVRSGQVVLSQVRLGQVRLVLSNANHFLKHSACRMMLG